MPVADYEKKYPFSAKETRGLTMRDAEWAFQLSPDPPKVEKLNDYIVMAARGDRNGFLFFLHAYEERLNCRIRSFLFREGYKRFYDLRDDPEKRKAYADEMEDYVRAHHLLIFDYPFVTHPELLREEDLYEHLSITKGSNVNVVRHLRYTPVFVHSHSFFTVLYVLRGQCGHTVGGADLPMKQGDVFFLPPYVKQTIEVFDNSIVLNLHIRRDTFDDVFFNALRYNNILSDFFMSCLYSQEPVSGILFHTGNDKDVENLFLEMYKEVQLDDSYSWRLLNYLVPLLFAKILRSYSDKAIFTGVDSKQGSDSNKLRILSFINDNYRTVTLEDVATHFNYSVPHCSKLIRDETGIGFVAFVRRIKMNHAVALLLNTRTSVADIANMVGYENPESFIRVFQKVYQMSPTAYRKKVTGE